MVFSVASIVFFAFTYSIVNSNIVENQESAFDSGLKMWFYKIPFQLLTWAPNSHTLLTDYLYVRRLFLSSLNLSRLRDLRDCQTDYNSNSYMCAFITCTQCWLEIYETTCMSRHCKEMKVNYSTIAWSRSLQLEGKGYCSGVNGSVNCSFILCCGNWKLIVLIFRIKRYILLVQLL